MSAAVAGVVVIAACLVIVMLPFWVDSYRQRRKPLPFKADVSGRPPFSQAWPVKSAPPKPPPAPVKSPYLKPAPADTSWLQTEGALRRSIHVTRALSPRLLVADTVAALEAAIPSYTDELIARIDRELAAEQHRQGMRYGRAGHCQDCDRKQAERRLKRMQRRCRRAGHPDVVETRTLDNPVPQRICATCGTTLEVTADDGT